MLEYLNYDAFKSQIISYHNQNFDLRAGAGASCTSVGSWSTVAQWLNA